jgi:N-acyl-D-aspartate/D-glutamate deacylase
MPIETAVYKMTGLAAENVGIKNRGIIKSGYFVDLVLFDPETIKDNATILNPTALSDGILMVWVNGKVVFKEGKATNVFSGRFVKRGE